MKKKRVKVLRVLFIFLLLIIIMIYKLSINNNKISLTSQKYNEAYFISNYKSGNFEDIKHLINLTVNEPKILYDQTTTTQEIDPNFCNIVYSTRIENITNKPRDIYVQFIVPEDLAQPLSFSGSQFGSLDDRLITLEPNKGYNADAGFIMKNYKKLNEEELSIFNEYYKDLNIIILIDGNEYFIKVDDLFPEE